MTIRTNWLTVVVAIALLPVGGLAVDRQSVNDDNFRDIHSLIKPRRESVRWEQIPWHLDLWEARRQAAAQGKPMYLWSAGGAPPIGGC